MLRIAVVGAGTAGLAAAAGLTRDGHDVRLLERFEAPRPLGSGLLLQPTGLGCLDRLGLAGQVMALGARVDGIVGLSARGRTILDMHYGRLGAGLHGVGIHRAALFDVLYREVLRLGVPIVTAAEIERLEHPSRGVVELVDHQGVRHGPFDLVIDASGLRSPLRRSLPGRVRAQPFRFGALWATVPLPPSWPDPNLLTQRYDGASIMAGMLPVGRRPGEEAPLAAFFWSLRASKRDAWLAAGLAPWKAQVARLWPEAGPIVAAIASPGDLAFARYDDITVACPVAPDLALAVIGDAAHATSPQLGQGANLALMDAMALTDALRETRSVSEALTSYAARRRDHVAFYQWASRWLTPFFQSDSRLAGWTRDLAFGPAGKLPIIQRQMLMTLAGLKTGILRGLPPSSMAAQRPPDAPPERERSG